MKSLQILFATIGFSILLFSLYSHNKANDIQGWQPVNANLEFAYTQAQSTPKEGLYSKFVKRKPVVKYCYYIKGSKYCGRRVMFLDYVYWSPVKMPDKDQIIVYYNPKNPSKSYIYRDYPKTAITMLLIASFSIFMIAASLRMIIKFTLNYISNFNH